MKNKNVECPVCRGKGRIGGCKSCGKELQLFAQETTKVIENVDMVKIKIPKYMLTNHWDKSILIKDHSEYCDDIGFNKYINQLDKAYETFKCGALIGISAIVCSPMSYAKSTWAHSCMIEAIRHGYNVAPLVDTAQLKRMLLLATEKPAWKNEYQGFSYNQIMESDILFLVVTRSSEYVYAYETLVNILDIRGREDKPTVILSDRSFTDLTVWDQRRTLQSLANGGTNINPYRYAKLIEFYGFLNMMAGQEVLQASE